MNADPHPSTEELLAAVGQDDDGEQRAAALVALWRESGALFHDPVIIGVASLVRLLDAAKRKPLIMLRVCGPCRAALLAPNGPQIDGWTQIPPICPECNAKIAQCARILVDVEGAGIVTPSVPPIVALSRSTR
jgi:hypothetical protein